METLTITLEEYRNLILENQKLRNEVDFLKNRLDCGIAHISMDLQEIKDKIK